MAYGIRVDGGIFTKPQVRSIARRLGIDRHAVVGHLAAVWLALEDAGEMRGDDLFAAEWTAQDVDEEAQIEGFADAMTHAGWLRVERSGVVLPGYIRHNGATTKERRRKQRDRWQRSNAKRKKKNGSAQSSAPDSAQNGASNSAQCSARNAPSVAKRSAATPPLGGVAAGESAAQPTGAGGALADQRDIEADREAQAHAVRERIEAMDDAELGAMAGRELAELDRQEADGNVVSGRLAKRLRAETRIAESGLWIRQLTPRLLGEAAEVAP